MNISWGLYMLCDKVCQSSKYGTVQYAWVQGSRFWICVSMLLDNAWICLNRPEAEPKITVQDN